MRYSKMNGCGKSLFRFSACRPWLLAAVAGIDIGAHIASADTYTYSGPASGAGADWNNANNWTDTTNPGTSGIPGSNLDDAYILGDSYYLLRHLIIYDPSVTLDTTPILNSLTIDFASLSSGVGPLTTNTLTVGVGSSVGGSVTLSGTGQIFAGSEYIGSGGLGNFTQSDQGTENATDGLILGLNGTGSYILSAGDLQISTDGLASNGTPEVVGSTNGTGVFAQSGGIHLVGFSGEPTDLDIGGGGTGTYSLSGSGDLEVSGTLNVGDGGAGTFSLSGSGYVTVTGSLNVGLIGPMGSFTQSGGSVSVADFLLVGFNVGSNSVYSLGGAGSLQVASDEAIGVYGSGTFTQTAGINSITSGANLDIAYVSGSTGVYNLSGTGAVVFGNPASSVFVGGSEAGVGGSGQLNVSGGVLFDPNTLEVFAGGAVNQSGGIISAGNTLNYATITETAGTASIGPITGIGSISIGAASGQRATLTAGGLNQFAVAIASTGLLILDGGADNTLDGLNIAGNGQFDLTNQRIFFNYASYGAGTDPLSAIRNYLVSGYNHGQWNGPGIQSSSAAGNSHYALGFADGADGVVAGLSSGQIEVAYTLYGDANLDGYVNGSDFSILASNFGKSGLTRGWDQGDFNYDGAVNGSDFGLLAGNFGKTASGTAIALPDSEWAALDSFAVARGLLRDVPEPSSMGFLAIGTGMIAMRRRLSANKSKPDESKGE